MAGTVSRLYGDFRGVDLRGEECSLQRSPDSLNMWKDYKKTESICTRPTLKHVVTSTHKKINGISFYKGKLMYHHGVAVSYLDPEKDEVVRIGGAADEKSQAFVFDYRGPLMKAND